MTFSIIIPTKERVEDLQNCIISIAKQTVLPQEVIVVDASSDDISCENKRNCERVFGDTVKFVYIRSESGVCRQRNKGADIASGEIFFFLDDDVVINSDYCEKILEVYKIKNDEKLGGVQGTVLNYYETTWLSIAFKRFFFMNRSSRNEKSRFLPSLGYVFTILPQKIIEVVALPSLVCSFYKSVFDEFRFDESFERCTDLEISYRVSAKYKLYQTPYALATHCSTPQTHLNIKERNKLYIIYTHKLIKKHMPRKIKNWLAYYWSIIGEIIFNTMKSCRFLSPDPLLGTLKGIRAIIKQNK